MSRNNRQKRETRKEVAANQNVVYANDNTGEYKAPAKGPIDVLTQSQDFHFQALMHDDLVIAIGSAGTGKTYLASAVAAELFMKKQYKKIIMSRPNVEVGRSLGYLPGDQDEKYAPYLEPFKKGLIDRLGSNKFKCDFKSRIIAKPLQYMRGETFDDSILLVDEAQNLSIVEMKMILTRIGTNSKLFITGDVNQTDLSCKESGLAWLVRQIRLRHLKYEVIEYSKSDCVRSGLCKEMLYLIEDAV